MISLQRQVNKVERKTKGFFGRSKEKPNDNSSIVLVDKGYGDLSTEDFPKDGVRIQISGRFGANFSHVQKREGGREKEGEKKALRGSLNILSAVCTFREFSLLFIRNTFLSLLTLGDLSSLRVHEIEDTTTFTEASLE